MDVGGWWILKRILARAERLPSPGKKSTDFIVTDHFTPSRHGAGYRDEPGKLLGVTRDPRGGIWRPLDCSDSMDGADGESPAKDRG